MLILLLAVQEAVVFLCDVQACSQALLQSPLMANGFLTCFNGWSFATFSRKFLVDGHHRSIGL